MRRLVLSIVLASALFSAGCGSIRDKIASEIKDQVLTYVETKVRANLPEYDAWKKAADRDKSGDTTAAEWKWWFFGGGGGLLALLEALRRYTASRDKKANERIDRRIRRSEPDGTIVQA